ncbi:hypothetical protein CF319_g8864 [Tilletia indica]|nr:hypothetical protein CF319_g8864 [Tilletia indica]
MMASNSVFNSLGVFTNVANRDLYCAIADQYQEDAAAAELRDKVFKFYEKVDAIFEGGIANGEFALDPGAKASKNAKEEDSVILVPTRILLILHLPLTVRKSKERTKTVDGQTGGERKVSSVYTLSAALVATNCKLILADNQIFSAVDLDILSKEQKAKQASR